MDCVYIFLQTVYGDSVTYYSKIIKINKYLFQGKTFSIWRLNDLRDLTRCVSLFLFGEVHKELWKTEQGTVIGLLNANPMRPKDGSEEVRICFCDYWWAGLCNLVKNICIGLHPGNKSCFYIIILPLIWFFCLFIPCFVSSSFTVSFQISSKVPGVFEL